MQDVVLHLGDCLEFMRTLEDGAVDCVVTDPPYGLGSRMNGGTWGASKGVNMAWDKQPLQGAIDELLTLAPVVAIWGGNYYDLPPSRCWLVWYKRDAATTMSDVELAWTNQDKISRLIDMPIAAVNAERNGHPTQKPVRVMRWAMDVLSIPKGATVFDPFMGSGTTGVACVLTGRNFVGCEIDPVHFATAQRRIAEAQMQPPLFPHEPAEQVRQMELIA